MANEDFVRIEKAMMYMEEHFRDRPMLEEMANSVHLSKYHFQRLFTRWVGISPGRFLQCLNLNHAKRILDSESNVLDASLEAGLSGPGRLHDLFVTHEAVSPGEFKRKGEGLRVSYGFHPTPFGECMLSLTERGVCGLSFVAGEERTVVLAGQRTRLERAEFVEAPQLTEPVAARLFRETGAGGERFSNGEPVRLFLHGTNFQVRVWEALLRIPPGSVATYRDVGAHMGNPGLARAVGQAAGSNPIALLIPCHRVIRKMGLVGGYRWGVARKRVMLAWEAARMESRDAMSASA